MDHTEDIEGRIRDIIRQEGGIDPYALRSWLQYEYRSCEALTKKVDPEAEFLKVLQQIDSL